MDSITIGLLLNFFKVEKHQFGKKYNFNLVTKRGVSWDYDNLYILVNSVDINVNANSRILNIFIDTDPALDPLSGKDVIVYSDTKVRGALLGLLTILKLHTYHLQPTTIWNGGLFRQMRLYLVFKVR